MFSVQPRFRFYGSTGKYAVAAKALLTGTVHDEDAVSSLETDISNYLHADHVIATQQCRFAIYLALKHLDCRGKKVILSPYTIYDVVNMVIAAGGIPVFCDIEAETCNINLAAATRLIDGDTAGIIITHLHGLMADSKGFRSLCDEHGLWLLEDAAQSYGAERDGAQAGTIGHVGAFSFGRAKNVNGFYGGALAVEDAGLADAIREDLATLKPIEISAIYKRVAQCAVYDLAMAPIVFQLLTFQVLRFGALRNIQAVNRIVNTESAARRRDQVPESYFRRMSGMQARAIAQQLGHAAAHTDRRIEMARMYESALHNLHHVSLPPSPDGRSHIYMYYPIQVPDRWALVHHLMRDGIDVAVQHYHNVAELDCFREFFRDCPVCHEVSNRVLLLPTYPGYRKENVRRLTNSIREFMGS